jgi:long-chain acyl-CoA synthetase
VCISGFSNTSTTLTLVSPHLLDHWQELVAANADSPALIEAATARVYSRGELDRLADEHLATWNRGPSLKLERARVAFALPNGAEWLALFLALLKSGSVPVPLDSSEPLNNQRELARHGGARFLWLDRQLTPTERPSRRDTADTCLIKLTSGSTGTPRALPFSHAEMIADGRQVSSSMDIRPDDRNLAIIPFGHSYGLGNLVMPLLIQGTVSICVSAPLPHAIGADLQTWKATVFPAVPALLRVLAASDFGTSAFATVRTVISAGSPLPPETALAFYDKYHCVVHSFYGSSETGGITYDRTGEATLAGRSVGTPLDGVTIRTAPGKRFWVESAAVLKRGNRQRSAAGHGAHRPADLGEFNAHGELVLLGRTGRMMKVAGRRIDLADFERTLRGIEGITDAFACPHPSRPEELAAAVATSLSFDEARARLRAQLAPWKMPRRLIVLPTFPLTARGKVHTRELKTLLA